jgi:Cdc25 family phosphatase
MEAYRLYTYQQHKTAPIKPKSPIPAMSSINLSDLEFINREDLSKTLLDTSEKPNIAIIDVRDSDHVGGHIKGSTWVPSSELDYKTPELVRTLKDKEVVVFHCALSQQRGPSAALRYLREKKRLEGEGETKVVSKGEVKEDQVEGEAGGNEGAKAAKKEQKVLVLEGGFTKWQEVFGEDERLTEGYKKDIWEFGY